jgi:hypothetical protein
MATPAPGAVAFSSIQVFTDPRLFVVRSGALEAVDTATGLVTRRTPLPDGFADASIRYAANGYIVTENGAGVLAITDTNGSRVFYRSGGRVVRAIACGPTAVCMYEVPVEGSASIVKVDAATGHELMRAIPIGRPPLLTSDNAYLGISNGHDGSTILAPDGRDLVPGHRPALIAFTGDGRALLIGTASPTRSSGSLDEVVGLDLLSGATTPLGSIDFTFCDWTDMYLMCATDTGFAVTRFAS